MPIGEWDEGFPQLYNEDGDQETFFGGKTGNKHWERMQKLGGCWKRHKGCTCTMDPNDMTDYKKSCDQAGEPTHELCGVCEEHDVARNECGCEFSLTKEALDAIYGLKGKPNPWLHYFNTDAAKVLDERGRKKLREADHADIRFLPHEDLNKDPLLLEELERIAKDSLQPGNPKVDNTP